MSGSTPPPSTLQVIFWWLQSLSPVLQTLILAVTGGIVWWYTKETQRLRKEAQRQVEAMQQQIEISQQQVKASQDQVRVTQEQIEVSQRPFIVIDPEWRENRLRKLKLRNIGNSAAINVEIVYGSRRYKIPIIETREAFSVSVQEDSMKPLEMLIEVYDTNVHIESIFFLDPTSISKGVGLKIEYCNVAMMQYSTTERILPTEVIIESAGTGKMGPYVQNR